jgi:hypothetical protein
MNNCSKQSSTAVKTRRMIVSPDFTFSLRAIGSATLVALTACVQLLPSAPRAKAPTTVVRVAIPFEGCRADGQVGPLSAPNGTPMMLPIAVEAAHRLTYYKAKEGFGVLGPRGWHCFCTYGSNGEALFVSPEQVNANDLLKSETWEGFKGPTIQISYEFGDTSGRFGVASTIARVFPARKEFVDNVIREGIVSADSFPTGPYPKDQLVYRTKNIVEFQTPANEDGLGTKSRLLRNADPISGAAILVGTTPDLLSLSVRLAPNLVDLAPVIIQQVEREATRADANSQ